VPLLAGSAAIDAGVSNGAPTTDQRGQSRPVDGDGNGSAIVDIGAVEFANATASFTGFSITPSSITETGGTATATITRNSSSGDLVVNLTSSDTGEATVPATITIADGATSATFTVTGVDDTIADGNQTVTITATANGFTTGTGTATVTVTDNDVDNTAPVVFEADGNGLISEIFAYNLTTLESGATVIVELADRNFATEDAFDNLVGLYELADENGGIDTNNDGVADRRSHWGSHSPPCFAG